MLHKIKIILLVLIGLLCCSSGQLMTATLYKCESGKMGNKSNKLIPYFSAAVPIALQKKYPYGSMVFVKKFKGAKMKNGGRHNGFFRIDDVCAGSNCWVKANGGWDWYPVLDLHVGRNGKIGSGAEKIKVQKKRMSNRQKKRLEQYAKKKYNGILC